MSIVSCPLCNTRLNNDSSNTSDGGVNLDCPSCGSYIIGRRVWSALSTKTNIDDENAAIIFNSLLNTKPGEEFDNFLAKELTVGTVKKMLAYKLGNKAPARPGDDDKVTVIDAGYVQSVFKFNENLPSPSKQLDNLLYEIYKDKESLKSYTLENAFTLKSKIGCFDNKGLTYLFRELMSKHYIMLVSVTTRPFGTFINDKFPVTLELTLAGFEAYEKLKRGINKSQQVFFALQFNSIAGERVLDFKKAVADAGFELKDMRELNQAGHINAQMEAQIRQSKFMVADITPNSDGAPNANVYWEAGFAEGLGIPVFYTCLKQSEKACKKDDTCEKQDEVKFPFDTRNHYHVFWSEDTIEQDLEQLTAAIRNTFPNEAQW